MPARRPYASRGVSNRATNTRSGNRISLRIAASLIGLLALIGLIAIWLANPFAAGSRSSTPPLAAAPSAPGVAPAGIVASKGVAAAVPPVLQMADVAVAPTATTPTASGSAEANSPVATPTPLPTLREWDAAGLDIVADPALVLRLDQALVGVEGHLSVAVKDLGSGRGAVLDGNQELPAASLYKLPILFSVFDAGLGMGEEIPITDDALAFDAGTMELGAGETLSVSEALERMVTISDNTAAVMLGSRVGGWRINGTLAALGMDTTHYSLERMTTSALDMLHLLDLMARGRAVSAAASADMVNLMLRQRVNDRLPRLLPGDVRVAHKTGNLPGTVNDVGILFGPTTTVAVAVLVSDTTDETSAAAGIARVALAAYTYFDDQPEETTRPLVPRVPARVIPPVWREPRPTPTPTAQPTPEPAELKPTLGPTRQASPVLTAAVANAASTAAPTLKSTTPAAATATPVPAQPTATPAPAAIRAQTRPPAAATAVTPAKR